MKSVTFPSCKTFNFTVSILVLEQRVIDAEYLNNSQTEKCETAHLPGSPTTYGTERVVFKDARNPE